MSLNIVVIGAGEVGFNLAKSLSKEDHDITVIDISEEKCNRIKNTIDGFAGIGLGESRAVSYGCNEIILIHGSTPSVNGVL